MPGIRQRSMTPTSTTPYPFVARKGLYLPQITASAVAPAWTPASLTSLVAWYDASDTATITQSGGAVSQWNDKSGNGRHLTQGTGAKQPTTGTRTINGINVLDFDGSDDLLVATMPVTAQPITVLMVYQNDTTANDQRVFDNGGVGGRPLYDASWSGGSAKRLIYAGGTLLTGSAAGSTNAEQFVVLFNGVSSQGWLNGTSDVTGDAGTAGLSATFYVGAGDTSGTSSLDGRLAEFVVTAAVPTSGERTSWNTYCARWGL